MADLNDLQAFIDIVRSRGFRGAAQRTDTSPSNLSLALRRLETRLGVRLLNRTTRSVAPTEAGLRLYERLAPALAEVQASLDTLNAFRERPAGTLRLNVPASVARLVLPAIVPPFLKTYPDIRMDVIVDDSFVDLPASNCDAGIRYDERLEQDMIAIPIGPRKQRFVTAAAAAYLDANGRPTHPRELLAHACLRGQFSSGRSPAWEFERDGEILRVEPAGPLTVRLGASVDLAVDAAIAGLGIIHLFEGWLQPHLDSGALEPILTPWCQVFSGPFLYYPGRKHLPAPLRAFVDFVKESTAHGVAMRTA